LEAQKEMIASKINWNGDGAYNRVIDMGWEGLQRATVYFHSRLLEAVGISAKIGKGTKAKDYQSSKPGEPPRKRTGWLQRHIKYELDKPALTSRIGVQVNALYGIWLELGTVRMKARPWLLATLKKFWDQIRAQAVGP
jgi:hypothetical protein